MATVQIRKLSFILWCSNFGCCSEHSKWLHDNKLLNKSHTIIHHIPPPPPSRLAFWVHLSQRLKCTIVITHCPSICLFISLLNFSHFRLLFWNFLIEWNLTGSKVLTSSTKFVFWTDRKNKMAALASEWLRHFRLLLWNCQTEFDKTWQEARS